MSIREKGTIKHFNKAKGFGFIQHDGSNHIVYFNSKDIRDGTKLSSGNRVEFIFLEEEKKLRANDITTLEEKNHKMNKNR